MSVSSAQDEIAATICGAIQQLTHIKMAGILLNTALALIEDGQSGEKVEKCIDVYLKTPGLPKEDVAKALLAQGSLNRTQVVQPGSQLGCKEIIDPQCQRAPPEIWEQVAAYLPRYHLRNWLFVSRFHRHIASRHIFHTIDLYFGDDEQSRLQALEIFDHAKDDPVFANQVKSLRLHCGWFERHMPELMIYIFKTSLPAFKALRNLEWIGSPGMPGEMVQALMTTHKHLNGLGLVGREPEFSATGVSALDKLRKIVLKVNESTDMGEICTVLNQNERTLKHLTLGGCPKLPDLAFESIAISNLTQLHLFSTRISQLVLTRITSAPNLQDLTLPGIRSFVDLNAASVLFSSDRVIDGSHTLLPRLEAFRFVLSSKGDQSASSFYQSVRHFLRKRDKLRRLDIGNCPWHIMEDLLPELRNLRALGILTDRLSQEMMKSLVKSIPREMVAISVFAFVSDEPLDQYASYFTRFDTLSFLHFQTENPNHDFVGRPDLDSLRSIAATIPSLDFLLWGPIWSPCVVVRAAGVGGIGSVQLKELPKRSSLDYGTRVDFGSDEAAWLEQKDVPSF